VGGGLVLGRALAARLLLLRRMRAHGDDNLADYHTGKGKQSRPGLTIRLRSNWRRPASAMASLDDPLVRRLNHHKAVVTKRHYTAAANC